MVSAPIDAKLTVTRPCRRRERGAVEASEVFVQRLIAPGNIKKSDTEPLGRQPLGQHNHGQPRTERRSTGHSASGRRATAASPRAGGAVA